MHVNKTELMVFL